jgi:hypothetical protein
MARPWIEFIYAQCLPWTSGAAGGARGDVDGKVLSRDAELGESSLILRYPAGWQRTAPEALAAEEEMYVLDGEITINGRTYRRDTYACFPAGYVRERASSPHGCVALTFFDAIPEKTTTPVKTGAPLVEFIDLYAMRWDTSVPDPTLEWMGNRRKVLRWDPVYDQKATFVFATPPHIYPEDWRCPTLTHPCVEESFMLAGEITGPHGRKGPGGYFWRPAGIPHGPFGTRDGGMSLIRFRHGRHVNEWQPESLPYSFDTPYKPALPPELQAIARDYWGPDRY